MTGRNSRQLWDAIPPPATPAPAGYVVPPGIAPVIIVQGSDYEMGYQYGHQNPEQTNNFKDRNWGHPNVAGKFGVRRFDIYGLQKLMGDFCASVNITGIKFS